MYYQYWGLKKPPFDNVPDPSMYVESHVSVENTIAETLFAIEEGNECITVIVGEIGLGKTLSLRIILDSLDQKKYKIAFMTNPDMTFIQLLREIIGQLTGKQCEERRKVNLLELFNKLLFETIDEGKKVLIFIDEANALSPANLESLRLLTNMQEDNRNLFTMVLAGQMELARRLEHPKRANLFQRIGTYNRINKIKTENLAGDYVKTRLKLAGGDSREIFTDDAITYLWEYSEHGTPRLVNKICKLCLKAGETNKFDKITGEVVRQIGDRFQKITGPVIQKRKPRKRPPEEIFLEDEQRTVLTENEDKNIISPREEHERETSRLPQEIVETNGHSRIVKEIRETNIPSHIVKEVNKTDIPINIIKQAKTSNEEQRIKLAGSFAAKILKKHPQLTSSPAEDPVDVWCEVRQLILNRL
jgi:general secretion pathway protein A